jgi:hypothetical protein
MQQFCVLMLVSTAYPLWKAWQANRRTALAHALAWTWSAWLAWLAAFVIEERVSPVILSRYLAIALSACAVVAVLGARRPGVVAWNFVVAALLAVTLLPLGEAVLAGGPPHLDWPRAVFFLSVMGVGVLNYLPTRLGPAAFAAGVAVLIEAAALGTSEPARERFERVLPASRWLLALSPWIGYACLRRYRSSCSECDRLWLDFRDRFGLVWGQRLREQFNRSAAHAGWPVHLYWEGLRVDAGARMPIAEDQTMILGALRALMKRFMDEAR